MKLSKHDKQVIQDEIDAAKREGERIAAEREQAVLERAQRITPPPPKDSFWTKLKRAIGAVP